jgi:hypothetical protein
VTRVTVSDRQEPPEPAPYGTQMARREHGPLRTTALGRKWHPRCTGKRVTFCHWLSAKHPKEPAMQIGEEQEEFEILPEEEQPLALPEREPQQHPEAAPA